MYYRNDDVYEVEIINSGTAEMGSTSYSLKKIPFEDTEIVEEIHIIRKRVKKSTDMDGKCFIPAQACAFDNWDWTRNPVANLYCGCPKHSVIC